MTIRLIVFSVLLFSSNLFSENPSDFSLPAAGGGKPFKLSEAKGKVVALHFLLKTQCPYCLRFTGEFKLKGQTIPDLVQVFIKPDAEEDIAKWSSKVSNGAPVIYQDEEAKLADRFGIPGGYKFHGQEVHYPATILLDQNGREFFRYVGKNNSDRVAFETFEAEVRKKTGR